MAKQQEIFSQFLCCKSLHLAAGHPPEACSSDLCIVNTWGFLVICGHSGLQYKDCPCSFSLFCPLPFLIFLESFLLPGSWFLFASKFPSFRDSWVTLSLSSFQGSCRLFSVCLFAFLQLVPVTLEEIPGRGNCIWPTGRAEY